jgi:hypothetical protein
MKRLILGAAAAVATFAAGSAMAQPYGYWGPDRYDRHDRYERHHRYDRWRDRDHDGRIDRWERHGDRWRYDRRHHHHRHHYRHHDRDWRDGFSWWIF